MNGFEPVKTANTVILSSLALLAFAGNSVLCRMALSQGLIDAGSFTIVRLISGALALYALLKIVQYSSNHTLSSPPQNRHASADANSGSWLGAISLFVYAAFFSYAYVSLSTATGALVLFGTVQLALILYGVFAGLRLTLWEWLGIFLACAGMCYLLWPELTQPGILGLVLMIVSGLAWAIYTIQGQGSLKPLADTTANFILSLPLVGVLLIAIYVGLVPSAYTSTQGILLAIASGVLTSGVGYSLWYAALTKISHTTASVSQLSVPVIAAVFGLVLVGEVVELRLVIAALLVLGGIFLVLFSKQNKLT